MTTGWNVCDNGNMDRTIFKFSPPPGQGPAPNHAGDMTMCTEHSHAPGLEPEDLWATAQEVYTSRFVAIQDLDSLAPEMVKRDRDFAKSLVDQFLETASLSPRQWEWVDTLISRVAKAEPIYGSFDPILVMFRLAQANGGLKKPRIRLLSEENEFVQLTFKPIEGRVGDIEIHTGGWAGHGRRQFAGWITGEKIIPYQSDRITPSIKNVIQDLALDPLGCAKAMAAKLGACMYCGSALTDPPSKEAGYGPVCASNYGLPWGGISKEDRARKQAAMDRAKSLETMENLEELF